MNILPALKRFVPPRLRPPLRSCWRLLRPLSPYDRQVQAELQAYDNPQVRDRPQIMDYWAKRYLAPMLEPFGFTDSIQFFRTYMARVCRAAPDLTCQFLSLGTGTCAAEINMAEWLREVGIDNYRFECTDLNKEMLVRGRSEAEQKGLSAHFEFSQYDANKWRSRRQYHVILALQSLHHVVELEALFDQIDKALLPDGYFLADDMIGRNGHQRWPEALSLARELWRELPDKYKYNQSLKRFEQEYDNWDCSTEGFEGIRAQDILPLLVRRFRFDLFIAFGNIIDIFIDRCFGPNFDPENEWDRTFIDRVHALDVSEIESGRLKPTHMLAAMTKAGIAPTLMHKHLSPDFCLRRTDI